MAQQGIQGTVQQRADLNERIPASEFRQFMQEVRGYMKATDKKFDALIQAGNDRDQQIVEIVNKMGGLRQDVGELKQDMKTVLQALGAPTTPPPSDQETPPPEEGPDGPPPENGETPPGGPTHDPDGNSLE